MDKQSAPQRKHFHVIASLDGEQFVSQPIYSESKAKRLAENVVTVRYVTRCDSPIEKGNDFCANTYAGAFTDQEIV